ncbi:hypothetical protein WME91_29010 [Sorangium sp. So ce269]
MKRSSLLAFFASALLMACSSPRGDGGGSGGTGGTGGIGGSGGSGGSEDCGAMRDDEALEEPISIVVTNERSTPVYLNLGEEYSAFTVDDRLPLAVKSPSCQGLIVGQPLIPSDLPRDSEIAAGASATISWGGRFAERIPVIAGCPRPSLEDHEMCSRNERVGDGAHELKVQVHDEFEEAAEVGVSPLPLIVVPFTLPAQSIAVTIRGDP